jgi:hypothetical protein
LLADQGCYYVPCENIELVAEHEALQDQGPRRVFSEESSVRTRMHILEAMVR